MKKTLPCYLSNPLEKITWWEHGRAREMESEAQKQNWKKKLLLPHCHAKTQEERYAKNVKWIGALLNSA